MWIIAAQVYLLMDPEQGKILMRRGLDNSFMELRLILSEEKYAGDKVNGQTVTAEKLV